MRERKKMSRRSKTIRKEKSVVSKMMELLKRNLKNDGNEVF